MNINDLNHDLKKIAKIDVLIDYELDEVINVLEYYLDDVILEIDCINHELEFIKNTTENKNVINQLENKKIELKKYEKKINKYLKLLE
jgi:hypothetical protein